MQIQGGTEMQIQGGTEMQIQGGTEMQIQGGTEMRIQIGAEMVTLGIDETGKKQGLWVGDFERRNPHAILAAQKLARECVRKKYKGCRVDLHPIQNIPSKNPCIFPF